MTEQRVPTEEEWELVAGVMGWSWASCKLNGDAIIHRQHSVIESVMRSHLFDPLHDSNDTYMLVRAMQAAGYTVYCDHSMHGHTHTAVWRKAAQWGDCTASTDHHATTFAIIYALAAEEKRELKRQIDEIAEIASKTANDLLARLEDSDAQLRQTT